MEFDFNSMVTAVVAIVIVGLIAYLAYSKRQQKFSLGILNLDELLGRVKEGEKLLQTVKEQRCWNCGETDKEVKGNLFEDNQIVFKCKKCGTETIWKRGKQWAIETGTGIYVQKLEERLAKEEAKIKA